MKVLMVTQSLGKGGAERLVLEIAHAFKKNQPEVNVKVLSLDTLNDYPELSNGLDIEYCHSNVRLSLTGNSNIDISEFEQIVDGFQPDVIHSHTYKAELVSRENPRKGIKYITHVHGPFYEFDSFAFKTLTSKTSLTRYFERLRIFKRYSQINNQFITISAAIDQQLRKQLGYKWSDQIHLIPNAIDYKKFEAEPHPPTSRDIQLISVGRMFPVKNHSFLIDVLSELNNIDPGFNCKLLIAGHGPLMSDLERKVKQLGLEELITFPGLVDNVQTELKKAHVYIHSARIEPFGLTLLEAMAASLPVVSIDGGGNRDFIINNQNGFLLSRDTSPEEFAQKIIDVIGDQENYLRLAKTANETAQQYDIKNYIERLAELYKV